MHILIKTSAVLFDYVPSSIHKAQFSRHFFISIIYFLFSMGIFKLFVDSHAIVKINTETDTPFIRFPQKKNDFSIMS